MSHRRIVHDCDSRFVTDHEEILADTICRKSIGLVPRHVRSAILSVVVGNLLVHIDGPKLLEVGRDTENAVTFLRYPDHTDTHTGIKVNIIITDKLLIVFDNRGKTRLNKGEELTGVNQGVGHWTGVGE